MKRPVTSSVIKNAEVKAGKENVRTNIRQEPVSYTHLDVYKRQVKQYLPCDFGE